MTKQRLFVDFDATIISTNSAFCWTYNELYINHPNFKTAEPDKVKCYDFSDVCPLLKGKKDVMKIFNHPLFFKFAEFINDNTYDVLRQLNEKYNIIVCSIGQPGNIAKKAIWLNEKLPFIKEYVLIANSDCKMDKSVVQMKDSIFIDDIPANLHSVDKTCRKILFGEIFPWNKGGWYGEHALNWTEVAEKLL